MKHKLIIILMSGTLSIVGVIGFIYWRQSHCQYIPWLSSELLPNANFSIYGDTTQLPPGWSGRRGVQLCHLATGCQGFALTGHSLLLFGIANYVETPSIDIVPGQSYCFSGKALTNSDKGSTTRLQIIFRWLDSDDQVISQDASTWQQVVLWQPNNQPRDWSRIQAAFHAPPGAVKLRVRLHVSSDDPVFLDMMSVRSTIASVTQTTKLQSASSLISVNPWPGGRQAALSFSFDWESAMGGLIHSRSLDDPNSGQDPVARGLRMREGITTTLAIFRPYNIQATYYATGYNLLLGNTERRTFMNNPTFDWANEDNRWKDNTWQKTPWFSHDPYGTYLSDPAWYFGDLIPLLRQARQDIQTHTFSHLYGGLASVEQWRADLETWRVVAAEQGVPPAHSLAFPWSSSAGMSDDSWRAIAENGITSVTRTAWSLEQFDLFDRDRQTGFVADPHCRPVPGHETILACPDLPLTVKNMPLAIKQIDAAVDSGGMIDLWAHTEEVVSADQIAAWRRVVEYAAHQRDSGTLWIAPLAEIATWQQSLAKLRIQELKSTGVQHGEPLVFTVKNESTHHLKGIVLKLPYTPKQIMVDGQPWSFTPRQTDTDTIEIDLEAGQSVEVKVWAE